MCVVPGRLQVKIPGTAVKVRPRGGGVSGAWEMLGASMEASSVLARDPAWSGPRQSALAIGFTVAVSSLSGVAFP